VVLEADGAVAARSAGEQVGDVRGGFPALGDVFGDDGGIEAGVDDLHSVEPVLDAIAAQDEARVVDITDRPARPLPLAGSCCRASPYGRVDPAGRRSGRRRRATDTRS